MPIPTTAEVLAKLHGYPRTLTWVSFRKVRSSLSPPHQAMTSTRWTSAGYSTRLVDGKYRPVFTGNSIVTVAINTTPTWVVDDPAAQTDDLLRHEQGHFDITGLIARDLCRNLMSIEMDQDIIAIDRNLPARPSAGRLLQAGDAYVKGEVDRYGREANALSARLQSHYEAGVLVDGLYDVETQHSQNALGQSKWNDIFRFARDNDTSLSVTMQIWA
jgi:hypothetical protein